MDENKITAPAPAGSGSPAAGTPAGSNAAAPGTPAGSSSPAAFTPAGSGSPAAGTDMKSEEAASVNSTVISADSAAPAGSDAAAPGSDAESEETASADSTVIPADAAEAPAENGEEEDDQWAAYEQEQAEIEESRRKPGKYRWTLRPDDMQDAMLTLEKAKGRYTMYKIASYVMILFALLPAADFLISRSLFSMIAALAALSLGIWIKGITGRAGRGAVRQMNPRGVKFTAEVKKHGLQVSDTVNKASLLPYSFFKSAYEAGDYLSLVTAKNTALHIKRDPDSASYRLIRDKMRQELGEHFIEKDISKIK